MKIKRGIFLLLLASILFSAWPASADVPRIEGISVSISSSEEIPLPIRERMEKSVYSVAEQLLMEKSIEEIRKNSDTYEKIIHEVFDKVLVGYTIQAVEVKGDTNSAVTIQLMPWKDVIRDVKIDVSVEGMTPLIEKMVLKDAENIESVFQETLSGLPVGAIDWSNGVLKKNVNSFMEKNIPEFRADFDIVDVAENTKVKVTLYPLLPVVRTLDLQMHSDTFPNFWLLSMREQMQKEANELIGVPVAFVSRHRADIAAHYSDILDSTDEFKRFHVNTDTTVVPSENMTLLSRSNLEKLRIRGESWSDIGHRHNGNEYIHRLRVRLGWDPDLLNRFYVISETIPNAGDWGAYAGYKRNVVKNLWLGLEYDFKHKKIASEVEYDFNKWWSFSHEYRNYDSKSEWGVNYKLHDFMALKMMYDGDGVWLRIIGNL